MTPTTNVNQNINVYREVKKHLLNVEVGLYIKAPNGQTFLIEPIHINTKNALQNYDDYGVALRIHEKAQEVIAASFPSSDVSLEEGMAVYYGEISKQEVLMCHKGRISSIVEMDEDHKETIFTIDGALVSHYVGRPVFTYDKIQKVLNFTGVIVSPTKEGSDTIGRAVHVNMFKQAVSNFSQDEKTDLERGKVNIQSSGGLFKGMSVGTGRGPRRIIITGESFQEKYKLSFIDPKGKELNPHDDPAYNKNQPQLYQSAIDAFENSYNGNNHAIPDSFNFTCYKNDYIARKEY